MEIVAHCESGLLAEHGYAVSLATFLHQMIDALDLLRWLGIAGRQRYQKLFATEQGAEWFPCVLG